MVTERREDTEGQSHKVDFEIVDMSGSTDVSQKKKMKQRNFDKDAVVWTEDNKYKKSKRSG